MDTLIPELDRICPGCDAPYLQCTSTTAQKWLGTCPACGWQGWQDLPPYALPAATRRRPPAVPTVTTPPARPDKNRVPLTNRRAESNKNQPLGARLFPSPRLQGYGFCGLGTEPPRPWPRWCRTLAPIFFTAALLTWVALAIAGVPLPGRAPGPTNLPAPYTDELREKACGWDEQGQWACVNNAHWATSAWCGTNDNELASCVVPSDGDSEYEGDMP